MSKPTHAIAFKGDRCIADGAIPQVVSQVKTALARDQHAAILMFDAATGEQIDLDLRDAAPHAPAPDAGETPRGPGRPRLGVVAREVTLLPRHWDWLNSQPGGASVALRKLVEHASRANADKDRVRASQNAAYRFMSAMAGNRAGFEEAARALFAGQASKFERLIAAWPPDIRVHLKSIAADAMQTEGNVA